MTILTFAPKFGPPAALNYSTMTSGVSFDFEDSILCIIPLETERLELMPDKILLVITAGGGPKSDTDDVFRGFDPSNSRIS